MQDLRNTRNAIHAIGRFKTMQAAVLASFSAGKSHELIGATNQKRRVLFFSSSSTSSVTKHAAHANQAQIFGVAHLSQTSETR